MISKDESYTFGKVVKSYWKLKRKPKAKSSTIMHLNCLTVAIFLCQVNWENASEPNNYNSIYFAISCLFVTIAKKWAMKIRLPFCLYSVGSFSSSKRDGRQFMNIFGTCCSLMQLFKNNFSSLKSQYLIFISIQMNFA